MSSFFEKEFASLHTIEEKIALLETYEVSDDVQKEMAHYLLNVVKGLGLAQTLNLVHGAPNVHDSRENLLLYCVQRLFCESHVHGQFAKEVVDINEKCYGRDEFINKLYLGEPVQYATRGNHFGHRHFGRGGRGGGRGRGRGRPAQ